MGKVFMQGNQAMAESAIRAGCKLFFDYPITPSSEVPEYYAKAMWERPEENITFIQAETETSAFNMVADAAATGTTITWCWPPYFAERLSGIDLCVDKRAKI